VIIHWTLSAPCIPLLRPWLLALSSSQVPAKFAGAAALTANANVMAPNRLIAKRIFLIELSFKVVLVSFKPCDAHRRCRVDSRGIGVENEITFVVTGLTVYTTKSIRSDR
jgi:hypothetical protein